MKASSGVWLVAGTTIRQPYPCFCGMATEWEHANGRCPCWGRTDVGSGAMPASCCGRVWIWQQQQMWLHRLTFQAVGS